MNNEEQVWQALSELNKQIEKLSKVVEQLSSINKGEVKAYFSCAGCGEIFGDTDNIQSIDNTEKCINCNKC